MRLTFQQCYGGFHVYERDTGGIVASPCNCAGKRPANPQAGQLRRLVEVWGNLSLDGFKPVDADAKEALERSRAVVAFSASPATRRPLMGMWFHGPTGVGKTHLAVGIVRALLEQRCTAWALDCSELAGLFSSANGYSEDREPAREELARLESLDALLIDDITWLQRQHVAGRKERIGTFETGLTLLLRNFQGALLLTSNIGPELETYAGERLWSRIGERCEERRMQGEDYRVRRAREGGH